MYAYNKNPAICFLKKLILFFGFGFVIFCFLPYLNLRRNFTHDMRKCSKITLRPVSAFFYRCRPRAVGRERFLLLVVFPGLFLAACCLSAALLLGPSFALHGAGAASHVGEDKIQKYSVRARCYCYGWALPFRLCFVTTLLNPQQGFSDGSECSAFVPQGCVPGEPYSNC